MENLKNEENLGTVKISDEVVSVIAAIAAVEIDGVQEIQNVPGVGNNITQILKGKKTSGKSVVVTLGEGSAIIEVNLAVEYGIKIPEVVMAVQENVKKTVEAMTGLKVESVNMNVQNIYMPKSENIATN
ncbi:MAG: Asp23/Gls24 family envelope stress response protein [Clostridium sp.]